MCDAAWAKDSIKLDSWLPKFSVNRYGACPPELVESWKLLRKSCYSKLMDHPQLGWQVGRCGYGTVTRDPEFNRATELFLSCNDKLGKSASYRADAIERSAITLGLKADEWFKAAAEAYNVGDTNTGDLAGKRGLELLTRLDTGGHRGGSHRGSLTQPKSRPLDRRRRVGHDRIHIGSGVAQATKLRLRRINRVQPREPTR